MNCDRENLVALALGDLNEAQRGEIEAHAMVCEACAKHLDELRRTVSLLECLPDGEVERPIVMSNLLAEAQKQETPARRRTATVITDWPKRHWRGAMAFAAAACLAVLCFRYGLSIRVGDAQLALGPQPVVAGTASPSSAPSLDREEVRKVVGEEIAVRIQPALTMLSDAITSASEQNQTQMASLANAWSGQRSADLASIQRSFWMLSTTLDEALKGFRTVSVSQSFTPANGIENQQ